MAGNSARGPQNDVFQTIEKKNIYSKYQISQNLQNSKKNERSSRVCGAKYKNKTDLKTFEVIWLPLVILWPP